MSDDAAPPWWRPEIHARRRPALLARARMTRQVRDWFEAQGFVEVQAQGLQVSPGNEAHLHAFRTDWTQPDGPVVSRYLHTSPEFACKKLLAAGEERIFSLGPVWRNREKGALHHPEFAMLEWYRAGEPYEALMADCRALAALVSDGPLRFRGRSADPQAEPERITVAEAFEKFARIRVLDLLEDRDGLAASAREAGIRVAEDDVWADVFSRVLVEKIEPNLGVGRLSVLCEYPTSEAALARAKPGDPRVAERFELYACGVELANAFAELTDPAEQRRRFQAEMVEKARVYGERYPIDEDFLAALGLMPPASGAALGFDRLVMLAVGAERIDEVIWTP